ncbi:ribosomal 40S subunit protein S13 [Diplodia intermedia]
MGRLHSKGKGIASSAIPYSRTPPAWLKTTPEQVVDQICKLAKYVSPEVLKQGRDFDWAP